MLEREGYSERIDHRSLKQQELELEPENYNPHVAERAELNGEKLRCAEVRRCNQAYLRAHPDHILAVVQAQRAVFGEEHVRRAFAKRLGLSVDERGGELERLMKEAISSPDLLPVITGTAVSKAKGKEEGGKPLYITMAKARMAQQLGRDAKALAESGMGLVVEAGQTGEEHVSTDAIETGTGPIVVDLADWKGRDRDDGRGNAADAGDDQGTGTPASGGDGRGRGRSGSAASDGRDGPGASAASRGAQPAQVAGARSRALSSKGPSAGAVREALSQRAEDLFRACTGSRCDRGRGNAALAMRGLRRGL